MARTWRLLCTASCHWQCQALHDKQIIYKFVLLGKKTREFHLGTAAVAVVICKGPIRPICQAPIYVEFIA